MALVWHAIAFLCFHVNVFSDATSSTEQTALQSPWSSRPGPIPGNSPFHHCKDSDYIDDLYDLMWVTLIPDPPEMDNRVQVMLNGTMKQNIAAGATINVIANLTDYLPPDNDTWKFCTLFTVEGEAETKCPPDKGETLLTFATEVTWLTPEANYTVKADARTKDGERIVCLEGDFEIVHGGFP
ncbi:Phosphatidylglycerol/phosphatidylinositol transfer protein [Oleoguttula sp. CCFEE 5521]